MSEKWKIWGSLAAFLFVVLLVAFGFDNVDNAVVAFILILIGILALIVAIKVLKYQRQFICPNPVCRKKAFQIAGDKELVDEYLSSRAVSNYHTVEKPVSAFTEEKPSSSFIGRDRYKTEFTTRSETIETTSYVPCTVREYRTLWKCQECGYSEYRYKSVTL
ncbi:MAG: hypothetical protein FWE69_07465 [Clostridiales bacterium]|nr:hypothetical protein [Clostridiales bacterium]